MIVTQAQQVLLVMEYQCAASCDLSPFACPGFESFVSIPVSRCIACHLQRSLCSSELAICLQVAVRKLMQSQLAAAWCGWQEAVQHSHDKQVKAQRAMSYFLNSSLRHAFDAWRDDMHSSLDKQAKIQKALSYFQQGTLRRAYDSWKAGCAEATHKKELACKAASWLMQSGLAKVCLYGHALHHIALPDMQVHAV